jgi:hypothetical protein
MVPHVFVACCRKGKELKTKGQEKKKFLCLLLTLIPVNFPLIGNNINDQLTDN